MSHVVILLGIRYGSFYNSWFITVPSLFLLLQLSCPVWENSDAFMQETTIWTESLSSWGYFTTIFCGANCMLSDIASSTYNPAGSGDKSMLKGNVLSVMLMSRLSASCPPNVYSRTVS